jgi:malonate-semialdehyde dehydrogenase (acetylating)/methylmalonate-semialdehyde dehydrogenase
LASPSRCGNTFVLKPKRKRSVRPGAPGRTLDGSRGAPGRAQRRARRQGSGRRHPIIIRIRAISFVGSSDIAHYVYSTGTANGKRVQAMGGAKNHGIIMPDADLDQVVMT